MLRIPFSLYDFPLTEYAPPTTPWGLFTTSIGTNHCRLKVIETPTPRFLSAHVFAVPFLILLLLPLCLCMLLLEQWRFSSEVEMDQALCQQDRLEVDLFHPYRNDAYLKSDRDRRLELARKFRGLQMGNRGEGGKSKRRVRGRGKKEKGDRKTPTPEGQKGSTSWHRQSSSSAVNTTTNTTTTTLANRGEKDHSSGDPNRKKSCRSSKDPGHTHCEVLIMTNAISSPLSLPLPCNSGMHHPPLLLPV